MKEVKLPSGHIAVIDDEDYDLIAPLNWRVRKCSHGRMYARSGAKKPYFFMHRVILGLTDPNIFVDHQDRNGLNNQRSNLRTCTAKQNNLNRIGHGKSKYRGVSLQKNGNWYATIKINGKNRWLGSFVDEKGAALAFNRAAIATGNQFCRLNQIED